MLNKLRLFFGKVYRIQYGTQARYTGKIIGIADNVIIKNPVYPEMGSITTDLYTVKSGSIIRSLYSCHMIDVEEVTE